MEPCYVAMVFATFTILRSVVCYDEVDNPTIPKNQSVEKTLIRNLLNRYQQFGVVGRPVRNTNQKITVLYGLALIQILDLDENKQILRTNCWSRYAWKDDLLTWNKSKYNNIEQIRVFPDQLWTPDIKLYNFADERMKEHREARVVVHSDGEVLWVPQALFKSTCSVEITYFPFDTQICKLEFGSWTYDITQLDNDWWHVYPNASNVSTPKVPVPYIDFNDYVESNEWETDGEKEKDIHDPRKRRLQIKSTKRLRNITLLSENGSTQVRSYAVLNYRIRLKRNPSFYVSILVIPCILLSCLTLVLFWLPPESPAKMMLGMNIFVAFFILLLLLAESTPSAVKNFPLIGSYYCLNMVMITLSTFLAVLVINLYFRGDRRGPLHPVFKKIVLEGLGRILMIRQNVPLPEDKSVCRKSADGIPTVTEREEEGFPELDYTNPRSYQSLPRMDNTYSAINSEAQSLEVDTGLPRAIESDIREIRRYIKTFVNRQKDKERKNMIAMEWRTFALILDRIFFVLYALTITVAIIILLPRRH